MPTIPAHREGQTSAATSRASSARGSVSRTPGMSMSLSRLDQLARPRQRAPLAEISALQPLHEHPPSPATNSSPSPSKKPKTRGPDRKSAGSAGAHSMSKSMSHLASTTPKASTPIKPVGPTRSPSLHATNNGLKKSPASASTGQLSASSSGQQSQRNLWHQQPVAPPRMTRAERLRLKARLAGLKRKDSLGQSRNGAEPNGGLEHSLLTGSCTHGYDTIRPSVREAQSRLLSIS